MGTLILVGLLTFIAGFIIAFLLMRNIQQQLTGEKIQLETQLRYNTEKLDHQKHEIENIGNKFENQFRVLANQILEEKKNAFNRDQESSLKAILDPLKENISSFKQEFSAKL